ncbi:LysR family glycine cleavage system transcriptional activator [Pseudoduganella flava]|uniref:LysR family glycine cleavage system transcriptional activator n=1 Tax=Pseudoduganella flava TaxID=871742 RepID=A0A562PQJ2_9BURK|nr:LysR substrate-binding domain-containing protein [Pseudoduganella flava]QGZ37824.1 LysR family transcriptional regulator [Pseudoduganella flava]TWI46648.1 LysR family glycine cleavage system transcriptional activator [Pseudoduganella flava]
MLDGGSRTLRSLSGLIDFDCAARWGSFTLAAQELHKTPAAISLQVKQLEEVMGFALFVRHPRHITLTEKGQELAITVARLLKELRTKVDALRGGDEEHVLRISTTHSFALKWLAPRLGQFTQLYPEIDLQLDSSERLVDVEHGDVDVAIRHGVVAEHPGMLFHERMVVVYSPALLADGQEELTLPDLGRHPLLYDDSTQFWAQLLRAYGVLEGEFEFSRGFTNMAVATQAAVAGQGIALVTYSIARDDLHRSALRLMRGLSIPYPRSYFLVISSRKAQREKVVRFRGWIEEQMAAMQRELDELTATTP